MFWEANPSATELIQRILLEQACMFIRSHTMPNNLESMCSAILNIQNSFCNGSQPSLKRVILLLAAHTHCQMCDDDGCAIAWARVSSNDRSACPRSRRLLLRMALLNGGGHFGFSWAPINVVSISAGCARLSLLCVSAYWRAASRVELRWWFWPAKFSLS